MNVLCGFLFFLADAHYVYMCILVYYMVYVHL